MNKIHKKLNLMLALLTVGGLGCRHELEVENLYQYSKQAEIDKSQEGLVISLIPSSSFHRDFYHLVSEKMEMLGGYKVDVFGDRDRADMTISIKDFCGGTSDWTNFLVCFPGFILFTHAWLGYRYVCEPRWDVIAIDRNINKELFRQTIDMELELRYAGPSKTWANIVGLCAVGVGWSVVNGICVAISYDEDATEELFRTTQDAMATYVAQQLVKKINSAMLSKSDKSVR